MAAETTAAAKMESPKLLQASDPSFDLIDTIKVDGLKIVCIGAGGCAFWRFVRGHGRLQRREFCAPAWQPAA